VADAVGMIERDAVDKAMEGLDETQWE